MRSFESAGWPLIADRLTCRELFFELLISASIKRTPRRRGQTPPNHYSASATFGVGNTSTAASRSMRRRENL